VGAVFISTVALKRLPVPHNPPENQQELLATVLHPIVAFVVLGSIIIHGLSIPFFSFGRNMTRTMSMPATITSLSRTDIPDWVFWARSGPMNSPRPSSPQPFPSVAPSTVDIEAIGPTSKGIQTNRDDQVTVENPQANNMHIDKVTPQGGLHSGIDGNHSGQDANPVDTAAKAEIEVHSDDGTIYDPHPSAEGREIRTVGLRAAAE